MTQIRQPRLPHRGYVGIGIYQPKKSLNLGGLWRAALAFGADFVFAIGERYEPQAYDTAKSWRHLPLFHYTDFEDFLAHLPHEATLVGVEIAEGAQPLPAYVHPERAVYLLGAEDLGLSPEILARCHEIVQVPTQICLNVAVTGALVLYDRQAKRWRAERAAALANGHATVRPAAEPARL